MPCMGCGTCSRMNGALGGKVRRRFRLEPQWLRSLLSSFLLAMLSDSLHRLCWWQRRGAACHTQTVSQKLSDSRQVASHGVEKILKEVLGLVAAASRRLVGTSKGRDPPPREQSRVPSLQAPKSSRGVWPRGGPARPQATVRAPAAIPSRSRPCARANTRQGNQRAFPHLLVQSLL